ncbi:MAG: pantetheine-phosphate adenylyltransferase [Deltaproteobacteria bacterium RBG_16_71_12]|nr:MAG: pantetheine-phosphate adenylyltransferase [Deltaproteobacteria bacterium RBG_16_71_12]
MIAVYAGTFDPFTAGHHSVVAQAAGIFSFVRVLIAVNPDKQCWFSREERQQLIAGWLAPMPNVSVDATEGLVVDYARRIGARFLVRGIRGASDASFETALAQHNRALAPDVQTVLLPAEPALSELSSSALKARALAGEALDGLCPPHVARALVERVRTGCRSAA